MLRRIPLGTMKNLRDLGGYPTTGGRMTTWEHILRGDYPGGLSEQDFLWFKSKCITTIIDLRSYEECTYQPSPFKNMSGFMYYACPLVSGDALPNTEAEVAAGYFKVLEQGEGVITALKLIASVPQGIFYHCTAGKDRTGILTALLFSLAGVPRPDILADYEISETYLGEIPMLAELADKYGLSVSTLKAFAGKSKPAYLDDCLTMLEQKYGTVAAYLQKFGLLASELDQISAKLLG